MIRKGSILKTLLTLFLFTKLNRADFYGKIQINHTPSYFLQEALEKSQLGKTSIPKREKQCFSYKNLRFAIYEKQIVGVAIVLADKEYEVIKPEFINEHIRIAPNFDKVCRDYFNTFANTNYFDKPYILALSVHKDFSGMEIGTILLKDILKIHGNKEISLDVLRHYDAKSSSISPAIRLYENYGFLEECETKGYSLTSDDISDVYHMVREVEDITVISSFYGIIIKMYKKVVEKNEEEYQFSHIYAECTNYEAQISLDGELIKGVLPLKEMKLVQAWLEIHKEALRENWNYFKNGKAVFWIGYSLVDNF